jgi:hypothetical protein
MRVSMKRERFSECQSLFLTEIFQVRGGNGTWFSVWD